MGFDKVWHDRYGNTVGVLTGAKPGNRKKLLLDIHADTVAVTSLESWQHAPYDGDIDAGRIYGRGACDIKGGLASVLAGLASLPREAFSGEIWVAATTIEEVMEGAALQSVLERGRPDYCVVVEPTQSRIGWAQKGRAGVRLEASGIPAHTSRAELGVNAVYRMLPAIEKVRSMPRRNDEILGSEVFELVEIISEPFPGNSIVPDGCRVRIDCRLVRGETPESLLERFRAILPPEVKADLWPVSVELYTGEKLSAPDFHIAWSIPTDHHLVVNGLQALRDIGPLSDLFVVPYCCNASRTTSAGVPTIVFGPGNIDNAHIIDEWVEANELLTAARAFASLAVRLLD
jgi:putative selenium metabolism hydrolase